MVGGDMNQSSFFGYGCPFIPGLFVEKIIPSSLHCLWIFVKNQFSKRMKRQASNSEKTFGSYISDKELAPK